MASTAEKGHLFVQRTAVSVGGFALLKLSFQTLGIIYSDIGTSPLYVLNGIWPASGGVPPDEDIIGGVSAILWSLTILPLLKYVFFSLRFGTNEGEGGTFALFQGLYPPEGGDLDSDRTLTGESRKAHSVRSRKLPVRFRWPLLIWALFGTSLTLADGILTPAVSVTSAVAGIGVAKPEIASDVIPISIGILVVLFLVQSRGTDFLSYIFAPITFIWLALLAVTGIMNITAHPGIFRALDPSRAIMLFVRTGNYDLLAGVLLAITGCEALFANLGQFNMLSIQLSFGFFVFPSLCLAYLGQGARLIKDGEAVLPNLFYNTIPGKVNGPLYWILFVFATLATIIASQAMITATFSLSQQLINMRSLPPLRLFYTSEKIQGQVYIPIVNYILMIATVVFVVGFDNATNLTNAYGFAVATVMFTTTAMIALQIHYVKKLPLILSFAFFLVFGFFDGLFWGASLRKVPEGAWVPLMVGCVLVVIMSFWTWARGLEDAFDSRNRHNLRHIIIRRDEDEDLQVSIKHTPPYLPNQLAINDDCGIVSETNTEDVHDIKKPTYYVMDSEGLSLDGAVGLEKGTESESNDIGLKVLARIPTCAIFHKLTPGSGVPHSFVSFFQQWPALPRVVVFLSVRVVPVARVPPEERYIVSKVRSIDGFYGVIYQIGFRDQFDVKANEIVERICDIETRTDLRGSAATIREIREVALSSTQIVPHYVVASKHVEAGVFTWMTNSVRRFLIEGIYRTIATMFPETANWLSAADRIIHVGINATI